MKRVYRLLAVGCMLGLAVNAVSAQDVYFPGNGVSLPVVIKEVHPRAATAATVALKCVVRADGTVSDIQVSSSPDPALDDISVQALQQWQFKPGIKEGKPVAVRIFVELSITRQ